jgi:hypothetical protein
MTEKPNLAAENLGAIAIAPLLTPLFQCDQLRISLNLELH